MTTLVTDCRAALLAAMVHLQPVQPRADDLPNYRGTLEHWSERGGHSLPAGWHLFYVPGREDMEAATFRFALDLILGLVEAPWQLKDDDRSDAIIRWVGIHEPGDPWTAMLAADEIRELGSL